MARAVGIAAALMLAWSGAVIAQQHETIEVSRYIRIDDQLFDRELFEQRQVDGQRQLQLRSAAPMDASIGDRASIFDARPWGGWDFGVVPIEFSPEISATRRAAFKRACDDWASSAPIRCVERTSQSGFLRINSSNATEGTGSPCYSAFGQYLRLREVLLNLGDGCWTAGVIAHELGHALGFLHEHQRPDRDTYLSVDLSAVPDINKYAFDIIALQDPLGPYDFMSIMHYAYNAFSSNGQAVLIPNEGYSSYARTMGGTSLSDLDRQFMAAYYRTPMRPMAWTTPLTRPRTNFDRNDFLDAMERLNAFYMSPMGLNRDAGLSIGGGPDFLGIATWIFDVYLAARSRGFGKEQSFQIVVADITQTGEWQQKHPGERPLSRPGFTPVVSFDRAEFLNVLRQLDTFYRAPEGLQRPDGLSINGGPDFLGIASWVFDVYLNERLSGGSPNVAWLRVVNAIQATDEWKGKHGR